MKKMKEVRKMRGGARPHKTRSNVPRRTGMITIPKSTMSKRLNTNRPICKMISGFLFVSDGTQDEMVMLAHVTDRQTNTMRIG
jgi:hypothetical protein